MATARGPGCVANTAVPSTARGSDCVTTMAVPKIRGAPALGSFPRKTEVESCVGATLSWEPRTPGVATVRVSKSPGLKRLLLEATSLHTRGAERAWPARRGAFMMPCVSCVAEAQERRHRPATSMKGRPLSGALAGAACLRKQQCPTSCATCAGTHCAGAHCAGPHRVGAAAGQARGFLRDGDSAATVPMYSIASWRAPCGSAAERPRARSSLHLLVCEIQTIAREGFHVSLRQCGGTWPCTCQ